MFKKMFMMIMMVLVFSSSAAAITGREVAERMDAVDVSKCGQMDVVMVIRRGEQKMARVMTVRKKKFGDSEKQVIHFAKPADVRGTSYLTWAYKDVGMEDDMWVYMPSESLVRRISGGGKKGPFMRSDYANEDISRREVADDKHTLVGEENLFGVDCYVVEMVPVLPAKTNYTKRLVWIRKDIWLPAKIEYYNKKNTMFKELLYGGYQKIQGIWTTTRQKMTTPARGTETIMEYRNVEYNTGLDDAIFQQTDLKR
ncbi:outer membrane lipoprotein-sorting protein [Maridesulfovibrio sp.]|uniref:outer membrane lipoprotein-sorting protein n=1 Tax=Maridesulfovibrio sp. TaxID=2795000 RepID=UPI0039EFA1C4